MSDEMEKLRAENEQLRAEIERLQLHYDAAREESEILHERLTYHRSLSVRIVAGVAIGVAIVLGLDLLTYAFGG